MRCHSLPTGSSTAAPYQLLSADSMDGASPAPSTRSLYPVSSPTFSNSSVLESTTTFSLSVVTLCWRCEWSARARTLLGVELPVRAVFEAPTVAALATRVRRGESSRVPLARQPRPDRLPLSFAQQRLWFLYRLNGPRATYNIPMAWRIDGALDQCDLEAALNDVITRHESLRTIFTERDGVPFQDILPSEEARCVISADEIAEADLAERLAAAAATPFDLAREIPIRAWLFRIERERDVLLIVLHHIAGDGWSLGPLWRDLTLAYTARHQGQAPAWVELPVQYADYTLWQRRLLGEEDVPDGPMAGQLAFWRQALSGAPDELGLPFDRPRPPIASHRGAAVPVRLDAELHRRLLELAQACGASLFMVLQAGLAALLNRLGAGDDIPIGTATAGRGERELEDLVGFFVNTLVMRTDISGNPSFRALVKRVRDFALDAYAHQDVPFERVVEALRRERSLARHPLFQVMFVSQNTPESEVSLPGLAVRPVPLVGNVSKFDLTLSLSERWGPGKEPRGIEGLLEYSQDLFDSQTANSMAARFTRLLAQGAARPDERLHNLCVLAAAERHKLLEGFNLTACPVPERSVPGIFESWVVRKPEAVALISGTVSVSYRELNTQANRLAHHLMSLGVGPETLVGICIDRSVAMVATLLAILKAGAAYVPIAPDLPAVRRDTLVSDSGLRHIVTSVAYRGLFVDQLTHVVTLDDNPCRLLSQREDNPGITSLPENLAYLNYTSGTTGVPKAVLVPHIGVVRLVYQPNYVRLDTSSRLLQMAPLSFDAATFEIWGVLLNGGSLVIMPPGSLSPQEIGEALLRHRVDTLWMTAGLFDAVVAYALPALAGVRQLLAGGDVLSAEHVEKVRRAHPDCQVINGYGPTENTTFTCCYPVPPDLDLRAGVPIGFPINNTRVYVLDAGLQPVPVGVTGEVYAAGLGLARGYLNHTGLTAERFVADPHATTPGQRMYRTGDLARWRSDGSLEFLGRADHQVKIRGFRIELGEIEAALAGHPDVAQAAVIAPDDGPAGKRLVGYIVAARQAVLDAAALRHYLAERLPDYMVPSAFVMIDALPLTPHGKLDRRALPAPERQVDEYRAPRTHAETTLCDIFADVLELERVGIDDNFFALGGHSLLATRVVGQTRVFLGVELPIRAVFEAPTVAKLATRVGGGETPRAPLVRQQRPDRLPLSFAQQRLWFLYRLEGPSATYNIPMALRIRGDLDQGALEAALADVVARHESLRTIFPERDGVPFQDILPCEEARCVISVDDIEEADLARRLAMAAATPFDLAREIPLRVWLFRMGRERHVLLILLHHIAGDGWSLGPLWRDLTRAYTARHQGEPSAWVELPVQYADYTLWQRALLGEDDAPESTLAGQLAFWRKALCGAPDELSLPFDRPRPPIASHRGATVPVRLDAELHQHLLELAHANGASLFMALQAALAALLNRLGAGDDIPIGVPVAGRGERAMEDLVGFFVNTLVMRTDLSGDPSFRELVSRVRAFALDAFAHQDVPFERVVETVQPARSLARHPLFQVMLVLQNTPDSEMVLPGLAVHEEPLVGTGSKFDLLLSLGERLGPGKEPAGIGGTLEYSTELFDTETADSIVARFVRLLENASRDPDTPLHRLGVLERLEREKLLEGFNATAYPAPETTLPDLFEAQVARDPEAAALIFGTQSLDYGELNARANRLAHHLIGLGVGPESLVGVWPRPFLRLGDDPARYPQGRRSVPAVGSRSSRRQADSNFGRCPAGAGHCYNQVPRAAAANRS